MAKEYRVLSITELHRLSDTKGTEPYYRHRIKTAKETVTNVDINELDIHDEDKVHQILAAWATHLDRIKSR